MFYQLNSKEDDVEAAGDSQTTPLDKFCYTLFTTPREGTLLPTISTELLEDISEQKCYGNDQDHHKVCFHS